MSHQPKGPTPVGEMQAEAYLMVTFYVEQGNERVTVHEADFKLTSLIGSLKMENQRQLGPPDNQRWYYNGVLMLNERTLKSYGIDGTDDVEILLKH
ncbi:hypothetical protein BsWGS_08031 [Bradybaena similaris]